MKNSKCSQCWLKFGINEAESDPSVIKYSDLSIIRKIIMIFGVICESKSKRQSIIEVKGPRKGK